MAEKVVDYVPSQERSGVPNIMDHVDKVFLISGYELRTGKKFDFALIETNLGQYRTSSKVLIDQLKGMDVSFKKGEKVRVKLTRVQNFYSFAPPSAE